MANFVLLFGLHRCKLTKENQYIFNYIRNLTCIDKLKNIYLLNSILNSFKHKK